MRCDRPALSAYLRGRLSFLRARRLERHAHHCRRCAAEIDDALANAAASVRSAIERVEPPADLRRRIEEALAVTSPRNRWGYAWALAVPIVLAIWLWPRALPLAPALWRGSSARLAGSDLTRGVIVLGPGQTLNYRGRSVTSLPYDIDHEVSKESLFSIVDVSEVDGEPAVRVVKGPLEFSGHGPSANPILVGSVAVRLLGTRCTVDLTGLGRSTVKVLDRAVAVAAAGRETTLRAGQRADNGEVGRIADDVRAIKPGDPIPVPGPQGLRFVPFRPEAEPLPERLVLALDRWAGDRHDPAAFAILLGRLDELGADDDVVWLLAQATRDQTLLDRVADDELKRSLVVACRIDPSVAKALGALPRVASQPGLSDLVGSRRADRTRNALSLMAGSQDPLLSVELAALVEATSDHELRSLRTVVKAMHGLRDSARLTTRQRARREHVLSECEFYLSDLRSESLVHLRRAVGLWARPDWMANLASRIVEVQGVESEESYRLFGASLSRQPCYANYERALAFMQIVARTPQDFADVVAAHRWLANTFDEVPAAQFLAGAYLTYTAGEVAEGDKLLIRCRKLAGPGGLLDVEVPLVAAAFARVGRRNEAEELLVRNGQLVPTAWSYYEHEGDRELALRLLEAQRSRSTDPAWGANITLTEAIVARNSNMPMREKAALQELLRSRPQDLPDSEWPLVRIRLAEIEAHRRPSYARGLAAQGIRDLDHVRVGWFILQQRPLELRARALYVLGRREEAIRVMRRYLAYGRRPGVSAESEQRLRTWEAEERGRTPAKPSAP